MALRIISPFQKEVRIEQEKKLIHYQQAPLDYGHFIVSRLNPDGSRELIGHIYAEIDGDETKYISTNSQGREIFSPTTDFNAVDLKFERYARLIDIPKNENTLNHQATLTNYSHLKNPTTMKTQTTEKQKFNQLVFVEYEKPTKEGHFITIVDSYRNNIGKIHKNYNEEIKKYVYTAFDHAGNVIGKNEQVWQLKNEFINNREELLEQAYQRRIESKDKNVQPLEQTTQPVKQPERRVEPEKRSQSKKDPEKQVAKAENKTATTSKEKSSREQDKPQSREQELEDLRDNGEDDREDHDWEL